MKTLFTLSAVATMLLSTAAFAGDRWAPPHHGRHGHGGHHVVLPLPPIFHGHGHAPVYRGHHDEGHGGGRADRSWGGGGHHGGGHHAPAHGRGHGGGHHR